MARRYSSHDSASAESSLRNAQSIERDHRSSYIAVLAAAVCCYAALGAVVRIIPDYVGTVLHGSSLAIGVAVGFPALAAVVTRPLGGRKADLRGTRPMVIAGGLAMAVGALPMFIAALPAFFASRLAVGAGEGVMMSATVLWLLRLAGCANRGRALGHVGLANYAGLTAGPLLADLLDGAAHPARVFACSAALPLVPLAIAPSTEPGQVPARRDADAPRSLRALMPLVLKPGIGLLLVNVGYAALLSFGPAAVGGASVLVLPLYALTVILVRTLSGGLPDRLGGRKTLAVAAPTAAAGLLIMAAAPVTAVALAGVVVLGVGQGFAVPALGLLALAGVPSAHHGAASGLFFAWFDAGVGLGGLVAGAAAGLGGPIAALAAASATVLFATAAALSD